MCDSSGLLSLNEVDLRELFQSCDVNKSGFIEKQELSNIIPNADSKTLERILTELDCDGDGKISFEELRSGLYKLNNSVANSDEESSMERRVSWSCGDLSPGRKRLEETFSLSVDDPYYEAIRRSSTMDLFGMLNSHYEAYQVYQHLAQQDTQMLDKFEVFLREAVEKIKEQSSAKEELEHAFTQEQRKQQERLTALEEEAEIMTTKIEQKIKQQLESKHEEDRQKYEEEISVLQENLDQMRQLQQELRQQAKDELRTAKEQLHDMERELKRLNNEKREAETNALLAKSQLATYKRTLEERATQQQQEELENNFATEQEMLVKQVEYLQDMNKQLHETNNDLNGELSNMKTKLSILEPKQSKMSLSHELTTHTMSEKTREKAKTPQLTDADENNLPEISLFDELENANAQSTNHIEEENTGYREVETIRVPSLGSCLPKPDVVLQSETARQSAEGRLQDEVDALHHPTELAISTAKKHLAADENTESSLSRFSSGGASFVEAPPERIYKVIFAGDSGVGKTTFITHLCSGEYQSNISTTLGVDFFAKNIEVDGVKISLQLWDTAGQERFRCISTSYFRKADGVVLLYDCCSERSFTNVRDWIATIRRASDTENLPIMMCANKIDAREERESSGQKVICEKTGEQLANQCGTMFCELSAKTGERLHSCVHRLARIMKEREDEGIKIFEEGLVSISDSKSTKRHDCC